MEKPSQKPRILLLQGPVGPFFKCLQKFLNENEYDAWRVCFNPGDTLFSNRKKRINFLGNPLEWETWLRDFLSVAKFDKIVFFGGERPLHRVARLIALDLNIPIISLEEGYVRPGFITVEHNGNNARSPIAGKSPPRNYKNESPLTTKDYHSFAPVAWSAIFYYVVRNLFASRQQRKLFHRKAHVVSEAYYWVRNFWRRTLLQHKNLNHIDHLCQNCHKKFFIIPLQVAIDSQLGIAAHGWNSARLISSALTSFAKSAPEDYRLIFKIHPLERGHSNDSELIYQMAEAFNVRDRVDVIITGPLGPLVKNAAGMVTINSTSGMSAIFHGVPLLVIGDAFYAIDKIATCAHGEPDYDSFWHNTFVADKKTRHNYIEWLKKVALKPGCFYASAGIDLACQGVMDKIQESLQNKTTPKKMRKRQREESL